MIQFTVKIVTFLVDFTCFTCIIKSTRATTLQEYNFLVHSPQVSPLTDWISTKLLSSSEAALEFFEIEFDSGEASSPDSEEAKTFIHYRLPPPSEFYGQNIFKTQMMLSIILKNVTCLCGYETPDAQFVRKVHLQTAKSVSRKNMELKWLIWLACESDAFTCSFTDMFNQADIAA